MFGWIRNLRRNKQDDYDPKSVFLGLIAALRAADDDHKRRLIEANRQLFLNPQTIAAIRMIADGAPDRQARAGIRVLADLLERCRRDGIDAVFKTAPVGPRDAGAGTRRPSPALQAVLEQIFQAQASVNTDPQTLVSLIKQAIRLVAEGEQPKLCAYLHADLGNVLGRLGCLRRDAAVLAEAVIVHRKALEVFTRSNFPMEWASVQTNLGNALQTLGELRADVALLEGALLAYQEALSVWTREKVPANWALAQMNLGSTLAHLGELRRDAATIDAAVEAYRQALGIWTRDNAPADWARVQMSLGSALSYRGGVSGNEAAFDTAVAAYREALSVWTRENAPSDWARVQMGLGNALARLGELRADPIALDAALAAHREALSVVMRENAPMDWATVQINRGNALARLGNLQGDASTLDAAVEAYREALSVWTRANAPADWARVKIGLGNALVRLGELRRNAAALEAAADAYREALSVWTRENAPATWARLQMNLGGVLLDLGKLRGDTAALDAAVEAYHQAASFWTRESERASWAHVQMSLGIACTLLGGLRGDVAALERAVAAHGVALTILDPQHQPLDWAGVQVNLGTARVHLGVLRLDSASLQQAGEAFGLALTIFDPQHHPRDWAGAQTNRGIALVRLGMLRGDVAMIERAVEAHCLALTRLNPHLHAQDWGRVQMSLGVALLNLGELRGDIPALERSEEAYGLALSMLDREQQPQDWANAQTNLGIVLARLGALRGDVAVLDAAVVACREALGVSTRANAPSNWAILQGILLRTLARRSRLAPKPGLVSEAIRLGSALLDYAYELAWVATGAEQQRIWIEHARGVGSVLADLYHRLGEPAEAVSAVQRGRAIALSIAMQAATLEANPALHQARDRWRETIARLEELQKRSEMASGQMFEVHAAQRAAASEQAGEASAAFRAALRAAGLRTPEPPSLSALRAALPEGGALVMLAVSELGTLAFALSSAQPSEGAPLVLELPAQTSAALRQSLASPWFEAYGLFLREIGSEGRVPVPALAAWNAAIERGLETLWTAVMGPLDAFLRERLELAPGSEVVIVPGDVLSLLPLHAARNPQTERYALEDWIISVAASTASYIAGRARVQACNGRTLCAVTDPRKDLKIPSNSALQLFAPRDRIELHGPAAGVEAVCAALPGHAYLSFDCHGSWNSGDPDVSALLMADGALTMRRLRQLDLSASRLAVLSACETGLVGTRNIEEVLGLPTAMIEAGVPGVVASLWPVESRRTQAMMSAMWQQHLEAGVSPAAALRAAQLAMLGRGGTAPADVAPRVRIVHGPLGPAATQRALEPDLSSSAPFFWAGFAMNGV